MCPTIFPLVLLICSKFPFTWFLNSVFTRTLNILVMVITLFLFCIINFFFPSSESFYQNTVYFIFRCCLFINKLLKKISLDPFTFFENYFIPLQEKHSKKKPSCVQKMSQLFHLIVFNLSTSLSPSQWNCLFHHHWHSCCNIQCSPPSSIQHSWPISIFLRYCWIVVSISASTLIFFLSH